MPFLCHCILSYKKFSKLFKNINRSVLSPSMLRWCAMSPSLTVLPHRCTSPLNAALNHSLNGTTRRCTLAVHLKSPNLGFPFQSRIVCVISIGNKRLICKKPFCSASHLFFFGYSNVSCWAWLRPCVSSGQGWFMGPVLGAAGFVPVTPEGASLSVLYPVIGYTSGGTPVTQLSKLQIELTNRINP